jgi:DNA-binding NarL/FixJ family response regulator
MVKVMIVDNEKHFLEELSEIFSDARAYQVCGVYTNASSAITAIPEALPD